MQPRKNASDELRNQSLDAYYPQMKAQFPEIVDRHVQAGETIFSKGDDATHYYVVEDGCVEIHDGGVIFNLLESGQGFGEMAIFDQKSHHVTAIARTDATITCISTSTLNKMTASITELSGLLFEQMRRNLNLNLFASTLTQVIGEVQQDIFESLTNAFIWQTYQPGETIFAQGDVGEEMFLLLTGRVRVSSEMDSSVHVLGELGRGTMFGELALLNNMPRSATITAIRETTVVCITRPIFDQLIVQFPQFARRMLAIIATRHQQNFSDRTLQQTTPMTFALIQGQDAVDMAGITGSLAPYLAQHGQAIILDEERFKAQHGASMRFTDIPPIVKQRWISDLEDTHDYIIFVINDSCSEWARWVAANADRVVIVDEARNTPQPTAIKQCIVTEALYQRYELLLLHEPDVVQPSGTAAWLEVYDVTRHHHVRRGDNAHFARLARLLTGNGIGIVLGGGGARGYAHIGVFKALLEANVPLDAIGCVSMGAVVGSAYLSGLHTDDVIAKIVEDGRKYGSKKALLDTTVPISAMMRSKRVTEAINNICGEMHIEDGWIPFFCISTNLTKQCVNIHQQGKLHRAVRASLSIPGIFSPVVRDGDLLVDGGVMNNFPVNVMRKFLEGGTVIGTVIAASGPQRTYEIDDEIDGFRAVLSRLIPGMKRKRVPSILKTIMAASSVNAFARQTEHLEQVDLLLQTNTAPYSTMDFDNIWELSERGYEVNHETVQHWAQSNSDLLR